jgi:hypothetical protein
MSAGGQVLVVCYFIAAFFAALVASAFVSARSAAQGDGFVREWGKRSLTWLCVMMGAIGAYFLIGSIIRRLYG